MDARLPTSPVRTAPCRLALFVFALLLPSADAALGAGPTRPPRVIRGSGPARPALAAGDEKLESRLRALIAPKPLTLTRSHGLVPLPLVGVRGSEAHVYVRLGSASTADLAAIAQVGLRADHVSAERRLVRGWLHGNDLRRLAALDVVRSVTPVRPGFVRGLAPDTAGDAAVRAPQARATGYDGTGVKVGVISDGIDHVASIADIPPGTGAPAGPGCGAGSGDEGTAMLEIVHDLAPGAQLMFSEGVSDKLAFVDSLTCLANAGAQIIVDDIGFFDEPFFEDGMVARAVRAIVQAGVSYHSAAGNDADIHYGGTFRPTLGSAYHNFATSGAPDTFDDMLVPGGGTLDCVLQWNDDFESPANNYDLELWDVVTNPPTFITSSTNAQPGTPALEELAVLNLGGAAGRVAVAIKKVSGANRQLSLFCFGAVEGSMGYPNPQGSIVGHPAVTEAVAVGAIDVNDAGLDTVETYSSQGPVTISFPGSTTRPKPDLAAVDGVSTSVPGFSPFFGTSAAAPHSAAVAALLLSKNSCQTPAQVQQTLRDTADDIGAFGFDSLSGAGRLDALNAIQAVQAEQCTVDADCSDNDVCTTDTCEGCTCVHRLISCSDGNACTTDTCDPQAGCQHVVVPDGTPCPDADLCNGTETCQASTCTAGTSLVCNDQDPCTADTCAPQTGCAFLYACDDDNPCTTDSCDPQTGCHHTAVADGTSCQDDNLCDGTETCAAGTCAPGTPLVCDDGAECSTNACDPAIGCTYPLLEGFPGLACLCDRGLDAPICGSAAPTSVANRFARACKLMAFASDLRNPNRARRLLMVAVRTLGKAMNTIARASKRRGLPSDCASALSGILGDTRARADRLAGLL